MIPSNVLNYTHCHQKMKDKKDNKVSITKVKKTSAKLLTKPTKDFDIEKSQGI